MPPPPPASPTAAPPAGVPAGDAAVFAPLASLGLLSFAGSDALAFLHGQLSSDVKALAPGAGHWTTYNSPKGRMLATLFLYRPAGAPADRLEALLAADLAATVAKRLAMFVLRSKVVVTDETPQRALFGVGGPAAGAAVLAALGTDPPAPGAVSAAGLTVVRWPDG
ncbi:MAG TPA: folate-binding protein, partial [Casimicrobiaceae bacterium]